MESAIPGGDEAGYASAIVVQGGGRKQYVQLLSKGLVGVDATTGQFLWRFAAVAKGPAQFFTPVANGEYVYCGALGVGGGMVRLKPDGAGVAPEQVYFERGLPNGPGGAVQLGGYIYGTEVGQALLAADFATGKVKWKADKFGYSSVASADGLLFLHLNSGEIVLVEASPEAFREKGRVTPPGQPKRKQSGSYPESAYCYPVIANGRLYIRDLETLWVYEQSGQAVFLKAAAKDCQTTDRPRHETAHRFAIADRTSAPGCVVHASPGFECQTTVDAQALSASRPRSIPLAETRLLSLTICPILRTRTHLITTTISLLFVSEPHAES